MSEKIKINKLEIENVKRVKAVKVEPTLNGLTVVGGKNNQGKTSVLDSIAWVLGGNKFKPSEPHREGSVTNPQLKVVLSNGIVVERKGKNSDLKVIDPNGNKGGQGLLDSFIDELALNLPKFMEKNPKEKAITLLQIIGVGDQLTALENEEKETYNKRLYVGQEADRKKKFAEEQTYYPDAPKEPVSAKALIDQQQAILAQNGENQRKRDHAVMIGYKEKQLAEEIRIIQQQLLTKQQEHEKLKADLNIANMDIVDLLDQSTEELEKSINDTDEINRKVRANLDKDKAEEDAKELKNQYDELTAQLNATRQKKLDLLNNAKLPLSGLSVADGEITYQGHKWDNMSGSQQLKVSTAIVRELNPQCGFVLVDKLEQMDIDTMNEFGHWLEQEGLQAIATRVSTGDECSIIIEDGYAVEQAEMTKSTEAKPTEETKWKAGEF